MIDYIIQWQRRSSDGLSPGYRNYPKTGFNHSWIYIYVHMHGSWNKNGSNLLTVVDFMYLCTTLYRIISLMIILCLWLIQSYFHFPQLEASEYIGIILFVRYQFPQIRFTRKRFICPTAFFNSPNKYIAAPLYKYVCVNLHAVVSVLKQPRQKYAVWIFRLEKKNKGGVGGKVI